MSDAQPKMVRINPDAIIKLKHYQVAGILTITPSDLQEPE